MVSVDNVYQKVLALANKEQRGYITPQEFNLFADQAQMEIFEQYFYDLQIQEQRLSDGSISELVQSKIEYFKSWSYIVSHGSYLPDDTYRVQLVSLEDANGRWHIVEKVDKDEPNRTHAAIRNLPLLKPHVSRPLYYLKQNKILFIDEFPGTYRIMYVTKPKKPNWTYLIGNNQTALFNPDASAGWQDFELHPSEEPKLVIKILQLAGINMKDYNLAQLAGQKEISVIQQEKQ